MDFFMTLVGIGLAGYVGWIFLKKYPVKTWTGQYLDTSAAGLSGSFWRQALRSPEVYRRLAWTVVIVAAYKMLGLVPLPGVNRQALMQMFQQISAMGDVLSMIPSLQSRTYLLPLGIRPYIFACIALQFFNFLIPPLRRVFFPHDRSCRRVMARMTLIAALLLAGVRFYGLAFGLEYADGMTEFEIISHPGWGFRVAAVLSLSAAFSLAVWMAWLITSRGIGNGFSVLLMVDLVPGVLRYFAGSASDFQPPAGSAVTNLLGVVCVLLLTVTMGLATLWKRDVAVRVQGREARLPMRLSWFGRQPHMLAMLVFVGAVHTAAYFKMPGWEDWRSSVLIGGRFFFYAVLMALCVVLTWLYQYIVYDSSFMRELLARYSAQLPDSAEGTDAVVSLNAARKQTVWISAGFLSLLTIVPYITLWTLGGVYWAVLVFNELALLLIIGVIYDVTQRLRVVMRMDETGFRKTCYVAGDEMEAAVKNALLEAHGIPCLVEPIRFTWGVPIRTALDEYRLNVAPEHVPAAGELL